MNDISKPGSDFETIYNAVDDSVKQLLGTARGLRAFLATVDKLDDAEQLMIVEQAIAVLEGFYAHLPLKRAMHAVDPLQRLRLLRRRLSLGNVPNEIAFHGEMTSIFTSLRDLHTTYMLPRHFAQVTASLPFRVKRCLRPGADDAWMYVVSDVLPGLGDSEFKEGVEVTHWNAVPMERAMQIAADLRAGSNPAARLSRGIEGLTQRVLMTAPPPDEEWVVVGYRSRTGEAREYKAEWKVINLPPADQAAVEAATAGGDAAADLALTIGMDIEADTRRRVVAALFASEVRKDSNRIDAEVRRRSPTAEWSKEGVDSALSDGVVSGLQSMMPDVFYAGTVETPSGSWGYLRIRSFLIEPTGFVNEVRRLITHPDFLQHGMVLDVRGNGGGYVWAGERMLQLFTPRTIEPTRAQFISTPLTIKLCAAGAAFAAWRPSLERTVETGAGFSAAFPLTPPAVCNDIGQVYRGSVVLLTDARCYSTTDMFTAGFKDHGIGPILGIDDNTGAGGANVWQLHDIQKAFVGANLPSPVQPLPSGAGITVAIRRTVRLDGTEIEDLGVPVDPAHVHKLTWNDIFERDRDLLARAGEILKGLPVFELDATASLTGTTAKVAVSNAKGLDRIDAYVDDRPAASVDVAETPMDLKLTARMGSVIGLKGFKNGELKAYRRLDPL